MNLGLGLKLSLKLSPNLNRSLNVSFESLILRLGLKHLCVAQ